MKLKLKLKLKLDQLMSPDDKYGRPKHLVYDTSLIINIKCIVPSSYCGSHLHPLDAKAFCCISALV